MAKGQVRKQKEAKKPKKEKPKVLATAGMQNMAAIKQIISPDASLRDAYTAQYARYRALYPAIEEARK